ncbi:hypothetical protein ACFQVC_23270 [Streptomyces monticola]|uniref:Uncharacterized protein n=1 Tax=Streptomyces monticola TaxID=2666263 RepID=A0ABW2JMX1_9ACTN
MPDDLQHEPAPQPDALTEGPPAWTARAERIALWALAATAVLTVLTLIWYVRLDNAHQPLKGWAALAAVGALLLICGIVVLVRPFRLTHGRTVLTSALVSVVLAAGTVSTWMHISKDDAHLLSPGTIVNSSDQARALLDKDKSAKKTTRIPTGLFIQQLTFDGPTAVQVSGYVWQRVPKGFPKEYEGVVLPDAEDSYGTKEVYRDVHTDGSATVGWYFKARVIQHFDYKRFPLDRQSVRLRLWDADRADNSIVLEPDFHSYPPWEYKRMLGTDPELVLSGWERTFSGWSYADPVYETTLGGNLRPYAQAPSAPPELYFNVGLAREAAMPMLSSLIRWGIVAVMIFLALFVYSKERGELRPNLGFSTWAVITFSVSMLLVIVVDQTAVREQTATAMAYVEWFALSLYVVILLVALNAVRLTSKRTTPGLEWQDNRLAKLLYWPLLLTLIFAATLYVFSPRW